MSKYIGPPVVSLSTDTVDVTGDITTTDATPEVIIVNDTHEDTDGGREGKVTFKGQQSGGEETTLAQIQASHDGTSDDEKGDLIFKTNGGSDGASPTEAMRIDSAGNVGIGGAASSFGSGVATLQLKGLSSGKTAAVTFRDNGGTDIASIFTQNDSTYGLSIGTLGATGDFVRFHTGALGTERMRIDSDGNVGVGGVAVASASSYNSAVIHARQVGSSSVGAQLRLTTGASGHAAGDGSFIAQWADLDLYITNQENASINFTTNGAERMSLLNNGFLDNKHALVATASTTQNTGFYSSGNGAALYAANAYSSCGDHMEIGCDATAGWASIYLHREWGTGEDDRMMQFNVNQATYGSILTTTSGTSFNTSSDYRMKENVEDLTDGITRVKQLQPKRFNFINDETNTLRDGFMAHEAQAVVPEAVKGTHNEVDDDGNPVMQQIDQAKLVPLLTAALQEAIAKIETLETKVAALEGE